MPKYVVRYGVMRHLGVFSSRGREIFSRGRRVIARTGRGQEVGDVLCEATEHVLTQIEDPRTGQILRPVSHAEEVELRHLADQVVRDRAAIEARIAELGLGMKIVDIERLYGGERVVVYYLAEDRIDFRELVRFLAKDLQTRVEMRHIGVRDEAKLLADYGDCGKPVCCNTHLSEMPPVSMKMAKLQKATLDPTKISGRCGRLKCCLRYEYDTYQELRRELPPVGRQVLTRDGQAKVLSQEILTGELLVETAEGRRVVINAADVLSVLAKSDRASEESASGEDSKKQTAPESAAPARSRDKRSQRDREAPPDASADPSKRSRRGGRRSKGGGDVARGGQDPAKPDPQQPDHPPGDSASGPPSKGTQV
ncbi:PSP1 domain-containing protein [Botrimarina hoheduenensis]|uniref:PSP1 C-terminal domain-containing protein n=1 Tax=Botrimarina hoheduenensis TaxID=2528000 RepID=A0A5C5W801_9BACT|nr:regulatory iron-sulfur-containing complex subunit RicT [Botrimarina hoheduenensis]TWT46714.1 hypothetical protein Pla111_18150 [Botrimarina hoheduenensis]